MPGHSHRVAPGYDPELARTLLAQAGYRNGRGFPELVVGQLLGYLVADEIAEQLAEIGLQVRVVGAPLHAFHELIARETNAFVWAWVADFPDPGGMIMPLLESFPFVYRDERRRAPAHAGALAERPGRAPRNVP